MTTTLADANQIPYFSWDRRMTVGEIQAQLATLTGAEWDRLAGWIMREAAFPDVWQFLKPEEVSANLGRLERFLGRKRDFWKYIIGEWHELGKL